MEGKKRVASSSSFTSELFGFKDSTSSAGIFSSIFAPPSKVLGRGLLRYEVMGKKQDSANEAWNTKPGAPDATSKSNQGEGQNMPNRDTSSIYQEQRVQPCHLSSSIYYGGQDIYHTQSSSMTSTFKKDGTEDDSGSASRGNWWKGSLYY
ncbi:uncharacterized protein LOC110620234 isoform X2 [Manihot esculenta]|uniref:Uncharacterized protein n=2 Tax=Manihot esculenta TaxID=3983 RepID=A0ACB7HCH4_MANES|nr:uncharacterized protein LOC110620234 isoform X2 [Manihot esculenta]KAG8649383.1 hypothetical protein MANES_08G082200v8 [Manihot esculenta]OAY43600.1 hypothetical protein MANES_08G082200v8 [Manihot esculenta]